MSPTGPAQLAAGPLSLRELARRTGLPPSTVRHYLRLGLLPPASRAASGAYRFAERHVDALQLVRLLQARRGLSLAEIGAVLRSTGLDAEGAFRPSMWQGLVTTPPPTQPDPRQRLVDAALTAFARQQFAEVRVEDLCRAAGIAKGSFYRYFRAKDELFFAAVSAVGDEATQAVHDATTPADAAEGLRGVFRARLPLLLELLSLAARRQPGHSRAAATLVRSLEEAVMSSVEQLGSPGEERPAQALVADALLGTLAPLVGVPPPHAARRGPPREPER